jgi:hypothetical protein
MVEGVDVLFQRPFTCKGSTTLLTFEDVSGRLEVLVKGLSTAEAPIAVIAFELMRRVEMLVEGLLATK